MKNYCILAALYFCFTSNVIGQNLYFPPLTGDTWESLTPAELNWCEDEIVTLYDFLEDTDSKAFLVLVDGKIVLEKYFGTFTKDSLWYWASMGKSLTAFATGIAQEEGLLSLNDPVSDYLGTGWTSLSPADELAITIENQLSMTTGLDDTSGSCTTPACLTYLDDAGDRWAYHNGSYELIHDVISDASGQFYNGFINSRIKNKTGMTGAFVPLGLNTVYFSNARSVARFGLTILNDGFWDNTAVLDDPVYLNQMLSPSQTLNPAYGYLWWLNGSTTYMLPQSQTVFSGPLIPAGPADMVSALGKNGQYLNIVPSENMILIRMGQSPDEDLVPTSYNSQIWEKMNNVLYGNCQPVVLNEGYFETGWDGWSDGGVDCFRYFGPRAAEGNFAIRIRDNSGLASSMTSPTLDLSGFDDVEIAFSFYSRGMEWNEDFKLLYNDGSSWTTIESYARGTDFQNNNFYSFVVNLSSLDHVFPSNAQFRFMCDASANNDQIYIDEVVITGNPNTASRSTNSGALTLLEPTEALEISTKKVEDDLVIYPNPSRGQIQISCSNNLEIERISVFSAAGQLIKVVETNNEVSTLELDISSLPAGLYFISLQQTDQSLLTKRFIVKE